MCNVLTNFYLSSQFGSEKTKKGMLNILKFLLWSFWWQRWFINFFKPTNSDSKTCKESNKENVHCLNNLLFVFPIGTEKNKERNAQHFEVSFWSFWWQRRFINLFKPTYSNSKTCKKSNIVNVHCLNNLLFVFPIVMKKRNTQHLEVSFWSFWW